MSFWDSSNNSFGWIDPVTRFAVDPLDKMMDGPDGPATQGIGRKLRSGMLAIDRALAPFDERFFRGREQAFLDYAMPQVNQQYRQARDTAKFGIARAGLSQSSAGAQGLGRLFQDYGNRRDETLSQARGVGKEARRELENTRSNLVNSLNVSLNPSATATLAGNAASALNALPAYSPIGNLFQNATAIWANDNTARAYGYPGMFGGGNRAPSNRSVRIVT